MRAPAFFAYAIFATALSPSLVSAAPFQGFGHADGVLSPQHTEEASMIPVGTGVAARDDIHQNDSNDRLFDPTHQLATAGSSVVPTSDEVRRDFDLVNMVARKIEPRINLWKKALDQYTAGGNAYSGVAGDASGGSVAGHAKSSMMKRTTDDQTMGGNAYTGSTGAVNGGSVENIANDGMPTIMNMNSNNAGSGGASESGCAGGGYGDGKGAGGNGYSGSTGDARGGEVNNVSGMFNMNSNNAGDAGTSQSGCAVGGSGDIRPSGQE